MARSASRRARRTPIALGAALAACGPPAEPAPPPAACDLLVVSLDTTRADVLTFADAEIAPHLTALAARGVVFDEAVAGSSWTLPTHVELFTGLPPELHGVHDDDLTIDPRHAVLGELCAARGMRTLGVWSGWYLAGAYGFARGFERWDCAIEPDPAADRALAAALERGGREAYWAADVRRGQSHRAVTSERVAERALEAVRTTPPERRLALFAHFFDPHYDFVPPPPYDTKFDPDYQGTMDGRDWFQNPRVFDRRRDPPRVIADRDLQHVRALYAGEVAWCDAQLGRVLDALREAGRLERTLIVVTADHGEEFFEHGNRGHRQTLYDEVLRVPLLVVPPAPAADDAAAGAPDPARRGTRAAEQVSLTDVLPTVLDYLGGPVPATVWGRSLRPRVEGGALDPRPAFAALGMTRSGPGGRELRLLEAVRTPAGKLVRRVRLFADGTPAAVERVEWYDLAADPGERDDHAGDAPALAAAWAAAEDALAELRAFGRSLPRTPLARRRTGVRDLFEAELEGLGYAGDGSAGGADVRFPDAPLPPLEAPAK